MYYWMPLPVASLRQLSVSSYNIGKLQDPAAACPIFVVVAAIFGWFWCNQSNHPKMDDCWAPSKFGNGPYLVDADLTWL